MADNFLDMPDDELPTWTSVEAKETEDREAADAAASTASEATEPAPIVTEGKTEEQIQAELEASAETDADALAEEERERAEAEKTKEVNHLAEPDDAPVVEGKKPEDGKEPVVEEEKTPQDKQDQEQEEEQAPVVDDASKAAADFHAKITAPFKANGREMQVKTPDEAVRLMQMGANYNQKMQALKPNLAMMRQLDDAGLLQPETIAQVVDLLKHKKPEAIAALAKSAGVDPLDLDEKLVADYKPQAAEADPVREALEETLDRIQVAPSYSRVMEQVKGYDSATKQTIAQNPVVLEYLESQMTSGVYDLIDSEIHRRKALGLIGASTPYIHAYKAVGDELNEQGAFNHLSKQEAAPAPKVQTPAVPAKTVVVTPVDKNAAVNERRRAAAPSNTSTAPNVKSDFNPLSMPDDEFEKLDALNRNNK